MRRFLLTLLLLVLVLSTGAGLFGRVVYGRLTDPFKGYTAAEQFVDLPPGSSTAEIGRRLVAGGVVRDAVIFRVAVWWTGAARRLKAGEYRFDEPLTAPQVVEKIARGEVFVRLITFPEGHTVLEMAKIWESKGFGPAPAFVEAARQAALVTDLDPAARDLEGYLFPDTYALPRGTSAATLVETMVHRFRANFGPDLQRAAAAQGMSVRQAVTMASLVEKETAKGDERPVVAAVYRNRSKIGMPMQADPTVIYALAKAGRYDGNIHKADLQFDSPYNTYRYPGLPPGPIASPGRASLDAAVHPAAVDFLYFVSRNDGSHVFARTLDEHNRNVRRFQVLFFREQRLRGQSAPGAGRR